MNLATFSMRFAGSDQMNQKRLHQPWRSSLAKPPWFLRNALNRECTALILSIGFSESGSPLVSEVGCTSLSKPSSETKSEWELSPSWMSLEPGAMWRRNVSKVFFFDGFEVHSGMTTRPFPSVAAAIAILLLDMPRSPFPSLVTLLALSTET